MHVIAMTETIIGNVNHLSKPARSSRPAPLIQKQKRP